MKDFSRSSSTNPYSSNLQDGIEMKLNKMNDKMTGIERKHDQIQVR